jgi:hypothetical protein
MPVILGRVGMVLATAAATPKTEIDAETTATTRALACITFPSRFLEPDKHKSIRCDAQMNGDAQMMSRVQTRSRSGGGWRDLDSEGLDYAEQR